MGPCAGGAVYSPAITDFNIMVEHSSYMFVTGPNVVKTVTHEEVSSEELGGASTHSSKSGVAHFSTANELEAIQYIKNLLSYLPQNCDEWAEELPYQPKNERVEALNHIVPESPNQPYDIKEVIDLTIDEGTFFEVHKNFAENIVVGFARLAGKSIGIVANQPAFLAGVLDIKSSVKAARFVRFCDAFNIPLLVFEDVPGFLPGTDQEWNAIITNGAKLLYAFSEATVPRITVITRKAYGGAYDVMNSKHIGADLNFAWPTSEIAVMGAKGAAEIIFKKEIQEAENPTEKWQEKELEYNELFANPYNAAGRGYIDEVILPEQTRERLIRGFKMLENKADKLPRKKHGNIPL
jgi:propionyl-CoA carboxylase beta chain